MRSLLEDEKNTVVITSSNRCENVEFWMRPAIIDATALNARLYLAAEGGHFLCAVPRDYASAASADEASSAAETAAEETGLAKDNAGATPSSLSWEVMGSRAARCVERSAVDLASATAACATFLSPHRSRRVVLSIWIGSYPATLYVCGRGC